MMIRSQHDTWNVKKLKLSDAESTWLVHLYCVRPVETTAMRYVPTCQSDNDTASDSDKPE
jgi:hypothetical protein